MDEALRKSALDYHRFPRPGKIAVTATKGLMNQRGLALVYSRGGAAARQEIVRDPAEARNLTSRGNLIGVVTNGTAALGLGAIGPLGAKQVMEGKAARPDAVIATGRSDYPNQVNNVLCFPFIFRGALDVGATQINEPMKLAAVYAIAGLAQAEQSEVATTAYGEQNLKFSPDYLTPTPFDPRLITTIAPAVAKVAMDSGVSTRPIADFDGCRASLDQYVYHSGLIMRPLFSGAKRDPTHRWCSPTAACVEMPTLDAANIALNRLKTAAGDGVTIGPILLGAGRPVYILIASATVRHLVNMMALDLFGGSRQV